ncbi:type II toxin-antitoxin system RelE/ParE family toxin [bacterium]|nr:type II toxin-antitoxin system RelE/ParE family toxin [bacterium]MBU1635514.1 type II toxin-antitoxin system RelE/ParE family toxin [bacterium]MBU1872132.1 type II toxin-antitoxin system RelE/ParE family toxin [bacterium]
MKYHVCIIADAEDDIFGICKYAANNDSFQKADSLLQNIEEKIYGLSELANRGHTPPELERIGIYEYREIHFKPYRIIYQIIEPNVYVHCVLDGRRDLEDLLQERLLR